MSREAWRNRIVGSGTEAPDQLLANPKNWRIHPKRQQDALAGELEAIGWVQQVIVNQRTGFVIDGHLRVAMAISKQEPIVPVLYVDLEEEEEARVLAVLDPIAGMAVMDKEKMAALLAEVAVSNDLLLDLARQAGVVQPATGPEAEVDRADELREKWGTSRGQLWLLGDHRLLCGDSTNEDDVARLMDGKQASLMATDPPYGIQYDSAELHRNGSHYDAIQHDDLTGTGYQVWLESCFAVWSPVLIEDAAWYLWHPMLTQGYFAAAAAAAAGVNMSRQIIWVKPQFVFGRGHYHWQHELCFYGWRRGHEPPFYGERNQTTVWELGYEGRRNDRDHPTQKPPELFAIPMRNHTLSGGICAEPFAGSGSQLVAAEQLGRRCYAMEIEPKYCAVVLERMAAMGLEPHLA